MAKDMKSVHDQLAHLAEVAEDSLSLLRKWKATKAVAIGVLIAVASAVLNTGVGLWMSHFTQ